MLLLHPLTFMLNRHWIVVSRSIAKQIPVVFLFSKHTAVCSSFLFIQELWCNHLIRMCNKWNRKETVDTFPIPWIFFFQKKTAKSDSIVYVLRTLLVMTSTLFYYSVSITKFKYIFKHWSSPTFNRNNNNSFFFFAFETDSLAYSMSLFTETINSCIGSISYG